MSYETKNIRNICLIGHGNNGKTSLAESMLYCTGAIDRMGKVAEGNTVCDYDPEETSRQITIATSVAPVNYNGVKTRRGVRHDRHLRQGHGRGSARRRPEKLELPEEREAPRHVLHLQVQ